MLGVPEGKNGQHYYFPDDLTDKAVQWLHGVRAQDARKPWMMYYSTGCSHAPHHVGKEWADKYKGQFDEGWEHYRQKTMERQKKLGIISGEHRTDRASRAVPGMGQPVGQPEEAVRPADGGVRRLLRERRLERRSTAGRDRGFG